jgi:thioredoxin-related protein
MWRFFLLFTLVCLGLPLRSQGIEWLSDLDMAKEKARLENKFVLINFTGSDWCAACIRLRNEVFEKPEFAEYAESKLVLVEVDFPRLKRQAHLQSQANNRLQRTYRVGSFPTLIVLSPTGLEWARIGFVPGGPAALITALEREARISQFLAPLQDPDPEPIPRKPVEWTPPPPAVPIQYGALALKGISGPQNRRMVLINNASLMVGEKAKVRTEDKEVVVVCKEIREDSVLITCDGKPVELKLARKSEVRDVVPLQKVKGEPSAPPAPAKKP